MNAWENLLHDVRGAVRTPARAPALSSSVTAMLGAGIGLAVAISSIADTVLLRPFAIRDQDRVVVLWGTAEGSIRNLPLTYEHFERFRTEARTLAGVAGTLSAGGWLHAVRDGDRVLSMHVGAVTGNFFDVLGVVPALGRLLRVDDDVLGAPPAAIVSHAAWNGYFGGDPGVIGRRVALPQRHLTYTIVGVAPPGLAFPTGTDIWVPLVPFARLEVVPVARLAPGATSSLAATELRDSFRRQPASGWRGVGAAATPLAALVIGNARPALFLLTAAAGLLLLIACMNVSNLLLVRTAGRMHELAVRHALGARHGRIVRQLFLENAILAASGGVVGAGVAVALLRWLVWIAPPELPRLDEIRLDGVSLGITVLFSATAVLLCGLLPALWALRLDAVPLGSKRTMTETRGTRRVHQALVVVQISLAIVILTVAGLLGRSLQELGRVSTGFTADGVAIVQLGWPGNAFDTPESVDAMYDRLIPRLEALPGVVSAAPVNVAPFTGAMGGWDGPFIAERGLAAGPPPVLNMAVVGAAYFRTMGIPMRAGRSFTDADREGRPRVAVVSETVARLFWPNQSPLGQRIGFKDARTRGDWWTVVGLVQETRYRDLREAAPTVYLPYRQFGGAIAMNALAVRMRTDPSAATPALRAAARESDPDVMVVKAEPMTQLLAGQLAQPRLSAILAGLLGTGSLLLATIGLYAILAYTVRQRTRELALRHVLGATPAKLRSLVLRQAAVLAGAGVVVGGAGAVASSRGIQSLLFGISPLDPLALGATTAVLAVVVGCASWLAARHATTVDAAVLLRCD